MENRKAFSASELRKSLNLIITAITFGMAFFVVTGGPPLTGFTRALGASDLVYGVIMAMPVLGGVVQIFASYMMENSGKRKPMFLIFGFIHRLLWIPIALVPFIIPVNYGTVRIWAVTVLITISSTAGSIVGVTFWSWMGALVPMDIRGRFFSKRTMISTISSAVTGMAVGKFLDISNNFTGFAIVFSVIAIFGFIDIFFFIWIKNPPMEKPAEKIPFIKLFSEPYKNINYLKFIAFVSIWSFGVNFAGPFFNVYMLEYLKMSYFTMAIFAQIIGNVSTIIFIRYWGRLVDKYGNKPVMAICCSVVVVLPLLWCFATPGNYWIVLILNFFVGIFWPGFDMTSMNLSVWLAPEKNRSIYIANYTLLTSLIGIAFAFVCGGAFMQFTRPFLNSLSLPFFMGQKLSSFHMLFIISALIRLSALLFAFPNFREENSKPARRMLFDIKSRFHCKKYVPEKFQ